MQENTIKNRFFIPNNDKNCTVSKKVRIETYGCQMNVADSEVVAAMMEMAGYETTENDTEAAAVLLNTCSIRDNAEQKIYSRIAYWNSMRRKLGRNIIIGVIGCMAERLKQELIDRHGVDIVAGPDAYLDLPNLVAAAETRAGNQHRPLYYRDIPRHRSQTYRLKRCLGVHLDNAGMQQFLLLLHRAIYPRTRTLTRTAKHSPRTRGPA